MQVTSFSGYADICHLGRGRAAHRGVKAGAGCEARLPLCSVDVTALCRGKMKAKTRIKRKLIEKVGTEVPAQARSWMLRERFDARSYLSLLPSEGSGAE